ncbi:MAG: hypothetical protein BGO49_29670 [Planctomycetales bacterium 71-10]|nr:MAG: hypothetical protein BGO49_29670 [Planctomycetales bacterium 71-10]
MLCGAISFFAVGCDGEDQPNASTPPEAVNEDFTKKTADMMRAANTGMDKKSQKSAKAKAAAEPTPAPDAAPPTE